MKTSVCVNGGRCAEMPLPFLYLIRKIMENVIRLWAISLFVIVIFFALKSIIVPAMRYIIGKFVLFFDKKNK